MSDKEISELNLKSAEHYGLQLQMNQFTEELAELIQAIAEENPAHIAEEIADVEIMGEQMEYLLTLDKDVIKRYANAHEDHDARMCFWFLAAPVKSINKLRRADLEASTSKRNAAKHSLELAIGALTSYLDWLVERFGISIEEIRAIKSYKVQRTRDRIEQENQHDRN